MRAVSAAAASLIASAMLLAPAAPRAVQLAEGDGVALESHGEIRFELGQIVNGSTKRREWPLDTAWQKGFWSEYIGGEFRTVATVKERLKIVFGLEGMTAFELPNIRFGEDREANPRRMSFSRLTESYFTYSFGLKHLGLTLGYFPINYAPEVHTFGAYLFKTGTYPGFVISGDGKARLAGFHLTATAPQVLRHDLFVTTEVENEPKYDWSISYLARVQIGKLVEFAAGAMYERAIPFEPSRTNPEEVGDLPPFKGYVAAANGDTLWYRKSGVKLMGRIVFDFKKLLPSSRLGEEDLKLYAEAALLGVQNQEGYYDDVTERVPGMIGLNLPAFGLLDVLGVEVEYYGSPYWNNPDVEGYPVPYLDWEWNQIEDPKKDLGWRSSADNIKWGVFARRTLTRGISVFARAASDHFRPRDGDGSLLTYEWLHAPDEWYWRAGVDFKF